MNFKRVYFLGIGGIGMSALARYFMQDGKHVAGYDRSHTPLTAELEREGADIHYTDNIGLIPEDHTQNPDTLVVYTPAIPQNHTEYRWFLDNGFEVVKRSEILGYIAQGKYVMAVAGTHGKTSTTTLTAWFNHIAGGGGSAFLGGISKNFASNLVVGKGNRLAVEADEFDRSFLRLFPDAAVITSTDADHLDIYGTHEELKRAFSQFALQVKPGGAVIIKQGIEVKVDNQQTKVYTYSLDDGDFHAENLELLAGGYYKFDVVFPDMVLKGCTLGIPGIINVENAIAAAALLWVAGMDGDLLRKAMASFRGVRRRFDFHINTPDIVYIDDYAHHPEELRAAISSIGAMFPGRKLTAVFQPHLYTRTRDFHREFAQALSLADNVILMPIYPARELPIDGVDSEMIGRLLTVPHVIRDKEAIVEEVSGRPNDVLVTFGAGDIDKYCAPMAAMLKKRYRLE